MFIRKARDPSHNSDQWMSTSATFARLTSFTTCCVDTFLWGSFTSMDMVPFDYTSPNTFIKNLSSTALSHITEIPKCLQGLCAVVYDTTDTYSFGFSLHIRERLSKWFTSNQNIPLSTQSHPTHSQTTKWTNLMTKALELPCFSFVHSFSSLPGYLSLRLYPDSFGGESR